MSNNPKPLALIILDGWGDSESSLHNPTKTLLHRPWIIYSIIIPATLLQASGRAVDSPGGK